VGPSLRWGPSLCAQGQLNRISSSGPVGSDRFRLDQRPCPVLPGRRRTVVNCNPNCNPCAVSSALWAGISHSGVVWSGLEGRTAAIGLLAVVLAVLTSSSEGRERTEIRLTISACRG
jgi:hypothetical protein